jgi:hypothetical protein
MHKNSLKKREPGFDLVGIRRARDILAAWKERGLAPVEATEDDFKRRIVIEYNAWKGKINYEWESSGDKEKWLKWQESLGYNAENIWALHTLSLIAETMIAMMRNFLKGKPRPKLYPGDGEVHIFLKDNRLAILFDPRNDPDFLKGILAAALLWVIDEFKKPDDFKSLDEFLGCFEFEVEKKA